MKSWFFAMLFIVLPMIIVGALLFSVLRYLWSMIQDRQLYRELDEIQAQSQSRREQYEQANRQRLDNGCQHLFDSGLGGGFPPGVCPKCGLAKDRPRGDCDHVWKRADEATSASYCVNCNKQYRPPT